LRGYNNGAEDSQRHPCKRQPVANTSHRDLQCGELSVRNGGFEGASPEYPTTSALEKILEICGKVSAEDR
jgi:hypothetical protein